RRRTMNAQKTRILKEARTLFWPWCIVILTGVLAPLLPSTLRLWRFGGDMRSVAFWIGLPLMATLALGSEFQHRTLMLLLSQPVDRKKLWAEKWIVLLVAVLSAGLVYWYNWRTVFDNETDQGSV